MTAIAHSDTAYHVTHALYISKAISVPLPGITRGVSEFYAAEAPAILQTYLHDNIEYVVLTIFDPTAFEPSTVLTQSSWQHHKLSETVARVASMIEFFRHYNFY